MKEEFIPSEAIGKTDLPDSPIVKAEMIEGLESAEAPTCTYKGHTYQKGAEICINRVVHKCGNHGWFAINRDCR